MLLTVGFATLVLLLDSVTTVSFGAAATNVTVPVTLLPPLIVLGFRLTDFTPTTTVRGLVTQEILSFPRVPLRFTLGFMLPPAARAGRIPSTWLTKSKNELWTTDNEPRTTDH
jgi:hypothetical protein